MSTAINTAIEPLIKRKIFKTEEDAIQELLQVYIWQQVGELQQKIEQFEQKYGLRFQPFCEYLHERSKLLESADLSVEQRRALNQAIMEEEDDWLEWKAAQEMMENWMGLRQEVGS